MATCRKVDANLVTVVRLSKNWEMILSRSVKCVSTSIARRRMMRKEKFMARVSATKINLSWFQVEKMTNIVDEIACKLLSQRR